VNAQAMRRALGEVRSFVGALRDGVSDAGEVGEELLAQQIATLQKVRRAGKRNRRVHDALLAAEDVGRGVPEEEREYVLEVEREDGSLNGLPVRGVGALRAVCEARGLAAEETADTLALLVGWNHVGSNGQWTVFRAK
jgi:hypothetical protein